MLKMHVTMLCMASTPMSESPEMMMTLWTEFLASLIQSGVNVSSFSGELESLRLSESQKTDPC